MRKVSSARPSRTAHHAAVFVDYANLHALLAERLDASEQAHPHIAEAVGALRRYLADEDGTSTLMTSAYADFSALGDEDNLQQALYHQGVEPRFVPREPEASAVQMQLSVDATTLAHRRPAVDTIAVVTGNRTFLPLVQALRREGAHAFVAALAPPPPDEFTHTDGDVFMDLLNLFSDAARRELLQSGEMPPRWQEGAPTGPGGEDAARYERLDDNMLFRTLEIAEEHFGQYDEVYLTPLLRKLSDVLGERFDPKALVSDLEDAGAVRLEKRRGYPYDYTVLIVERGHPDVQQMEEDFYDDGRSHYERGGRTSSANRASLDDTSGYDGPASDPDETDARRTEPAAGSDGENDSH